VRRALRWLRFPNLSACSSSQEVFSVVSVPGDVAGAFKADRLIDDNQ